jgi:hypothetical protein
VTYSSPLHGEPIGELQLGGETRAPAWLRQATAGLARKYTDRPELVRDDDVVAGHHDPGDFAQSADQVAPRFRQSQRQLAELLGKAKGTISEHIKHIFEDGELDPTPTVRRFAAPVLHRRVARRTRRARIAWVSGSAGVQRPRRRGRRG